MTLFLRIAADLRRRIESGELPTGARVPSTRVLAKKWKVATATAAHALRSLTHDGLIHAVPRSGTVVSGAARAAVGSAPARVPALARDRVVAAAVAIADAEGLSALSIRGLASRLDTPAMSLYRHVRDKNDLIALMTEAALSENAAALVASGPMPWRARLELGARLEWAALRKHPWLARVLQVSRPAPLPSSLRMANWVLEALDSSPLDAEQKLTLHVLLHSFIQGVAVNLEAEAQSLGETGITDEDHMERNQGQFAALAASGQYPYFAKMMREMRAEFAIDFDALFEKGLRAMLAIWFTPLVEPPSAQRVARRRRRAVSR